MLKSQDGIDVNAGELSAGYVLCDGKDGVAVNGWDE